MKEISVKVGNKTFVVDVANDDDSREWGLQNTKSIEDNKGMLFIFDEPDTISMWMKDTIIPLDIIFINDDLIVKAVRNGNPLSEELLTEENTLYILEVNKNSGISIGDELEFLPDSSINSKMLVLDPNGDVQMQLDGGERIFSRISTKGLIRKAKKAKITGLDKDYRSLGKCIFKELEAQNNRSPEYVESKN